MIETTLAAHQKKAHSVGSKNGDLLRFVVVWIW